MPPLTNVIMNLIESDKIIDLEEDLDVVLRNIAYTESSNDLKYIQKSKKFLKKEYGSLIESLGINKLSIDIDCKSPILLALYGINNAYESFIYNNWKEMSIKQREQEAEDILGENFFLGEIEI